MEFLIGIVDVFVNAIEWSFEFITEPLGYTNWFLIPYFFVLFRVLVVIVMWTCAFAFIAPFAGIIFVIIRGILIYLQVNLDFKFPIIGQKLEEVHLFEKKLARKREEERTKKEEEKKKIIEEEIEGYKESEEKLSKRQREIISDFAEIIMDPNYKPLHYFYDENILPHPKQAIIKALVNACNKIENTRMHDVYSQGLSLILSFQKGVGMNPVGKNNVLDAMTLDPEYIRKAKTLTSDEINGFIEIITKDINKDLRTNIHKKVKKDAVKIIKMINDDERNKLTKKLIIVQAWTGRDVKIPND